MPQGESVLDASMMADLIESIEEIVSQPKEVRRNLAHRAEKPRRGGQSLQRVERLGSEHYRVGSLFLGVRCAGIRCLNRNAC